VQKLFVSLIDRRDLDIDISAWKTEQLNFILFFWQLKQIFLHPVFAKKSRVCKEMWDFCFELIRHSQVTAVRVRT
jgi:hypothetical protein